MKKLIFLLGLFVSSGWCQPITPNISAEMRDSLLATNTGDFFRLLSLFTLDTNKITIKNCSVAGLNKTYTWSGGALDTNDSANIGIWGPERTGGDSDQLVYFCERYTNGTDYLVHWIYSNAVFYPGLVYPAAAWAVCQDNATNVIRVSININNPFVDGDLISTNWITLSDFSQDGTMISYYVVGTGRYPGLEDYIKSLSSGSMASSFGYAYLVNGQVTVATSDAQETASILVSYRSSNGNVSAVFVCDVTNGVSFTIKSADTNDNNRVDWVIYKTL